MNFLQLNLLKISEQSCKITSALLVDIGHGIEHQKLTNGAQIALEVNHLCAVINLFRSDFNSDFPCFISDSHQEYQEENKNAGLFFWLRYSINAANNVSKLACKSMQFGLNSQHPTSGVSNHTLINYALRDLFMGINSLNIFHSLTYVYDSDYVKQKIKELRCLRDISIDSGYVSSKEIPDSLKPLNELMDEYFHDVKFEMRM